MKSRFIKSAVLVCACAAGATVFGGVAKAQLQIWTIESVRVSGTFAETGSGANIELLPDLSGAILPAGQTGVSLTVYDGVPEPGMDRESGDWEALTTGARYIVRVSGPAGQTHKVSFLLRTYADASAYLTAPATYSNWGQNETDIIQRPSPSSRVEISSSASGGGSVAPSVVLQGPPGGGDAKSGNSKTLVSREVTFDSTGHAEIELPFALKVKGKYKLPKVNSMGEDIEIADGASQASAYVDWSPDTRGVRLTRQGAVGEIYDSATNTTTGDTTYSYVQRRVDSLFFSHPNHQGFSASVVGDWPTNYGWSWSTINSQTTRTTNGLEMPYGNLELQELDTSGVPNEWRGTPTGIQTVNLRYTATDPTDSATATAKYVLKIHDEVEKVSEGISIATATGPLWGSDPNAATNSNDLWIIRGPAAEGSREFSKGHSSSSGWSVSVGSEADLPFEKIKSHLGFSGEYHSDHSEDASGTIISPQVPSGYFIYPIFAHHYSRKTVSYRHYKPAGEHQIGVGPAYPPHRAVADQYAGSDMSWSTLQEEATTPLPIYDPNSPSATTPNP